MRLDALIFVVFCIDLIGLASTQQCITGIHQPIEHEIRNSTKVVHDFWTST
jgi:hypothetical protein